MNGASLSGCRSVLAFVLGIACSLPSLAASPKESLDAALGKIHAASGFPGFCTAIVNADGVIYRSAFGFADLAARKAYTAGTIQPIGSISKTLIGVSLMKAVEQGHFKLDTPINDVLPFKVVNPYYPDRPITIRQLATHTSGIVDREAAYESAYEPGTKPKTSLKAFLSDYFSRGGRLYARENFARTAPGQAYRYTNVGAALAGYLIEVKSGLSYADYTKKYILEPAHMSASGWFTDETKADNATLYENAHKAYPVYSLATYPDGGLHTSCSDLGRYLALIIAGYRGSSPLLAPGSFRVLLGAQFDPARPPQGVDPKHPNQGIFWELFSDGEIGHYGGDPGLTTFMSFNPDTGLGRVFLTNIGGEDAMTNALAGQLKAVWTTLHEYAPRIGAR